jgi:hypothetical protein
MKCNHTYITPYKQQHATKVTIYVILEKLGILLLKIVITEVCTVHHLRL